MFPSADSFQATPQMPMDMLFRPPQDLAGSFIGNDNRNTLCNYSASSQISVLSVSQLQQQLVHARMELDRLSKENEFLAKERDLHK